MQDGFDTAASGQTKRHALTAARDIIIFDFDGVLNLYGGLSNDEILALYARNKIKAVREVYPNWEISDEYIVELGRKSYNETGDGKLLYADEALRLGLIKDHQTDEYREKMLRSFHRHMLEDVRLSASDIFNRDDELISVFRTLKQRGFRFGILTQSCKENWVIPILEAKGLLEFFNKTDIFDFHDSQYALKAKSAKPLTQAIDTMGILPEHTIFVEDSEKNLEVARSLNPNIFNGYISDTQKVAPHIDCWYKKIEFLLSNLVFLQPTPQHNPPPQV